MCSFVNQIKKLKKYARVPLFIFFHIILPSLDALGDIYLAYKAKENGFTGIGLALLTPVLVNTIFTARSFAKYEENKKWTWPLVILQFWPQYRATRIVLSMWRDYDAGDKQVTEFEDNVGPLEPFLESLPQTYIKFYIMTNFCPKRNFEKTFGDSNVFLPTLIFSGISGLFALTRYQFNGQMKLLPKTVLQSAVVWILAYVTFAAVFVSKTTSAFFFVSNEWFGMGCLDLPGWKLLPILFVPNMLLALLGTARGVGLKRLPSILLKCPMLLILPVYTPFTYSRLSSAKSHESTLCISKGFTLANGLLHLLQMVPQIPVNFGYYFKGSYFGSELFVSLDQYYYAGLFSIVGLPLLLSIATVFMLIRLGMPFGIMKLDDPDNVYVGIKDKMFLEEKLTDLLLLPGEMESPTHIESSVSLPAIFDPSAEEVKTESISPTGSSSCSACFACCHWSRQEKPSTQIESSHSLSVIFSPSSPDVKIESMNPFRSPSCQAKLACIVQPRQVKPPRQIESISSLPVIFAQSLSEAKMNSISPNRTASCPIDLTCNVQPQQLKPHAQIESTRSLPTILIPSSAEAKIKLPTIQSPSCPAYLNNIVQPRQVRPPTQIERTRSLPVFVQSLSGSKMESVSPMQSASCPADLACFVWPYQVMPRNHFESSSSHPTIFLSPLQKPKQETINPIRSASCPKDLTFISQPQQLKHHSNQIGSTSSLPVIFLQSMSDDKIESNNSIRSASCPAYLTCIVQPRQEKHPTKTKSSSSLPSITVPSSPASLSPNRSASCPADLPHFVWPRQLMLPDSNESSRSLPAIFLPSSPEVKIESSNPIRSASCPPDLACADQPRQVKPPNHIESSRSLPAIFVPSSQEAKKESFNPIRTASCPAYLTCHI